VSDPKAHQVLFGKNKRELSRSVLRFFLHMGRIGREIGGKSKSAAKARALAQNARLGGRPRKIARSGGDDPIEWAEALVVKRTNLGHLEINRGCLSGRSRNS
jgi:hypothetical protein